MEIIEIAYYVVMFLSIWLGSVLVSNIGAFIAGKVNRVSSENYGIVAALLTALVYLHKAVQLIN